MFHCLLILVFFPFPLKINKIKTPFLTSFLFFRLYKLKNRNEPTADFVFPFSVFASLLLESTSLTSQT